MLESRPNAFILSFHAIFFGGFIVQKIGALIDRLNKEGFLWFDGSNSASNPFNQPGIEKENNAATVFRCTATENLK